MSSIGGAAVIELLLALINNAGPVSEAIRKAHSEGRTLSKEELQAAFEQDDASRYNLMDAIDRA
jgi:hypothetical protein